MKKQEKPKEKTRAQMIIDGEIEPEKHERGLLNLRKRVPFNEMPPEKFKEIARKGAEATNQLHGEKRSAKQALEKILTLKIDRDILEASDIPPEIAKKLQRDNPNATIYDLIQAVAVGRALDGNMKAYELIRDTNGDKPETAVKIDGAEIITEKDRALLEKIAGRLDDPALIVATETAE